MQPAPGAREPVLPTALPPAEEKAFSASRVISRTFSTWRRHVLVFSLMTLAADLPIFAVAMINHLAVPGFTSPNANPFDPGAPPPLLTSYPRAFWIAYLGTMILILVELGAITHGVINHLAGRRVSVPAMVATGLRRLLPALLAGIVSYLMIVFGMLLVFVPGLIFACALAPVIPVVVAERRGVFGAIGRSFFLTKGKRWAILGVFALLFLFFLTVSMVGSFVLPALTRS
ncbi:MAG TPA: hypothetical protein VF832_12155, partial [Longimicrobiales bacterium]